MLGGLHLICRKLAAFVAVLIASHAALGADLLDGSTMVVDRPFVIDGTVSLVNQSILITGDGRIIVSDGSSLSVSKSQISINNITGSAGPIIELGDSALSIDQTMVVTNTAYIPFAGSSKPWDDPPKWWAVGLSASAMETPELTSISVSSSEFLNQQRYSIGAIGIWGHPLGSDSVAADGSGITGKIVGNVFTNFHGAIQGRGLRQFTIENNLLQNVSFANIAASGVDITIGYNKIFYPGSGTTGDGITSLDRLTDSSIVGNTIVGGSCYGILMHVGFGKNIEVSGNTITNGITSALMIRAETVSGAPGLIDGISVRHNVFLQNNGFGLATQGDVRGEIMANHFDGNAPRFPAQIFSSSPVASLKVAGNRSPSGYPLDLTQGIHQYSTVSESADMIHRLD